MKENVLERFKMAFGVFMLKIPNKMYICTLKVVLLL